MFFLVSGAAASGKTTVVRGLRERVPGLECHDHDEKPASDAMGRCATLEEWVCVALSAQEEGRDFLLASHSPLGELLACPSAPALAGIAACLLDCDDRVRITRLRERGIDPRWPPTQDTVSWAAWHRLHAWDPQWESHVIEGNGPPAHDYARWTSWTQGDPRWRVHVIDTSDMSPWQTVEGVALWVEKERGRMSALSVASRWWE